MQNGNFQNERKNIRFFNRILDTEISKVDFINKEEISIKLPDENEVIIN